MNADALRAIAEDVLGTLPDADAVTVTHGQFHDVVLVPGVAAVRVARQVATAALMPRRCALLHRLDAIGLPFHVPVPLGDVVDVNGRSAVALTWIDGAPLPRGVGDAHRVRGLLEALRAVPLAEVADVLDEPHAYAGRERWSELLYDDVIPRLPEDLRAEATRRIDAARTLPTVEPSLVHGDLGGENVLWDSDGDLVGVIDWDLAQPFDQAVDVACLAWHGWDTVRAAVDEATYERARTWWRTFGIEQVASAIDHGEPPEIVDRYVRSAAEWLVQTMGE